MGGRLFEVGHLKVLFRGGVVGGGGRLFEAGCLLNFSTFRVGAYSRWALIRGWALNRINTVLKEIRFSERLLVLLEIRFVWNNGSQKHSLSVDVRCLVSGQFCLCCSETMN